jgi:hypothetical protein
MHWKWNDFPLEVQETFEKALVKAMGQHTISSVVTGLKEMNYKLTKFTGHTNHIKEAIFKGLKSLPGNLKVVHDVIATVEEMGITPEELSQRNLGTQL